MRTIYEQRRATLLGSLLDKCGAHLRPYPAVAGLHIAAALGGAVSAGEFVARAAKEALGFAPSLNSQQVGVLRKELLLATSGLFRARI